MEFLLFIVGFYFAFYVLIYRYIAINSICEFLFCLERINVDKLFNYDLNKELFKTIKTIDLRYPNFDVDFASIIFKDPKIVANDLYVKRQGIHEFLQDGYFPADEYFRINTDLLSELLRNHDEYKAKLNFVIEYIIGNSRVSEMVESRKYGVPWFLDESDEDKKRKKLKNIFENLEENQLEQVALYFLSEAKKGLISMMESIKQRYIEAKTRTAVVNAGLVLACLLSLLGIFFFIRQSLGCSMF